MPGQFCSPRSRSASAPRIRGKRWKSGAIKEISIERKDSNSRLRVLFVYTGNNAKRASRLFIFTRGNARARAIGSVDNGEYIFACIAPISRALILDNDNDGTYIRRMSIYRMMTLRRAITVCAHVCRDFVISSSFMRVHTERGGSETARTIAEIRQELC